jgi:hypothetical protein
MVLSQILQSADAFLLLNGHPCRVDPPFERIGSFELVPRPKLDCRQCKRKALCGNRQTRMHQDTTTRVVIGASLVILARRTFVQPPNFINIFTLETEFGRGN